MSKALATKKKATHSSTDSSSASSSDSSSSSSSSSGSGSSSSSDSESSSSQESSGKHSSSDQKKSQALQKTQQRKSVENKPPNNNKQSHEHKSKPKAKPQKPPPPKSTPPSSDDEAVKEVPTKSKKKANIKPKSSATVSQKSSSIAPKSSAAPKNSSAQKNNSKTPTVKPTGGKVPPKSNPAAKTQLHKNRESQKSKSQNKASKIDVNKKKSIFSPENSSESEGGNEKAKTQALKSTATKPRPKATAKPVEKNKSRKVETKQPKSKEIISSASSTASSTESSSTSDTESSTGSTNSKKDSSKKAVKKAPRKEMNTDSETESKHATRKLTRSSNTRKSKHVLGKNVYTDTDSDTESTKRSQSRSPVKRAAVSTKGKAKNKKNDSKSRVSDIVISEERKCPLEKCNSLGHLGGRQDKHFTIDACPIFHNTNVNECKEACSDRKKREENRKKIIESNKKSPKGQINVEQKSYLQKIRECRAKFKMEITEGSKTILDKNREPNLENFVPEYDLKLFRDAQALASEKIEEELKTQPNTKDIDLNQEAPQIIDEDENCNHGKRFAPGTKYIEMGKFEMEVWYQSPYPEEFARLPKLYICEYCLRYMRGRTVLQRHAAKCVWRHPPGEEVYRKDKISVWEVDGKRYKQYCQNLCLLAKFFLDHKTLYYEVEPFLFYVMTMLDSEGCHTVGYFSKEKNSFLNYNVSCILTLPPYQRQGYGRLLIDFSYLLTRVEGKIGSPEKPLSDLGLISYRSYWKDVLLNYLCSRAGTQLSVKDISQEMAIHSTDIVSTLQALGMMKYWKGKHIILKKQDVLDEYVDRVKRRGSLLKEVDPECLRWTPFVPPQPNPS